MILNCINVCETLLDTQYRFIIGRKGITKDIVLSFDKNDFHHILGLHYLTDLTQLKGDRERIYDKVKNGSIPEKLIEKSVHYHEIEDARLKPFLHFMNLIENDNTVFRFNKISNRYVPFSKIRYEYLLECTLAGDIVYVFLSKKKDGSFFVISLFRKAEVDYTYGNTPWTVLKKQKITLSTNSTITLFKNPNYVED